MYYVLMWIDDHQIEWQEFDTDTTSYSEVEQYAAELGLSYYTIARIG